MKMFTIFVHDHLCSTFISLRRLVRARTLPMSPCVNYDSMHNTHASDAASDHNYQYRLKCYISKCSHPSGHTIMKDDWLTKSHTTSAYVLQSTPSFQTPLKLSVASMSSNGLPSTSTKSALRPALISPRSAKLKRFALR